MEMYLKLPHPKPPLSVFPIYFMENDHEDIISAKRETKLIIMKI